MLRKVLAPMFFASILIVAGCSSEEASKDLNNTEDINDEQEGSSGSSSQNQNNSSDTTNQSSNKNDSDKDKEKDESTKSENKGSTESSDEDINKSKDEEESDENIKSGEENQTTETNTTESGGSGGSGQPSDDKSADQSTSEATQQQYTFAEVNGEAVKVIEGFHAVEIKRKNINNATENTNVLLKAGDRKITLTYDQERDSFQNYQIKDIQLEELKSATVIVKG